MFRSPAPHPGFDDQMTDGGGPAFLRNEFIDAEDADHVHFEAAKADPDPDPTPGAVGDPRERDRVVGVVDDL